MQNSAIRPVILVIGLISILLTGCSPSEKDQQALAAIHLKQASAYLEAGQFRAAMIEAKNVIQKSPNTTTGYVISAKILNTLGQHRQAIDLLEPLSQSMPVNAELEQALVSAYIGKRKFHTAIATLNNASQLKQHNIEQYNLLLAESLRETGKFDEASALYHVVLSNNSASAEAHIGIALIWIYQNNFEKALHSLEEAQANNPDNTKASLILAQMQYAQKDYAAAESLLTDTLLNLPNTDSITPERAATLNLLADVLVLQGRTAEAMIYTQKLADAFPGYNLAIESYNEAEQLAKEGKLSLASKALEQLLADNPGFQRASSLLAVIKFMQGDFASASNFLGNDFDAETAHPDLTKIAALSHLKNQKAESVIALLEGYPNLNDDSNLLAMYGAALLATNQTEKSVTALNRAIEINPNTTFAYLSLASYYNQSKQTDKALQYLQTANAVEPGNPLVVIALAKQYISHNESAQAEQLIQQHIEMNNQSSASLELAGDFYIQLKEYGKAQTYFQQSLDTDQQNFTAAIKLARALEYNQLPFDQVIAAYRQASNIEPENPIPYEYILQYTDHSQQFSKGVETVEQIANTNQSSIGYAVLTLHLSHKGDTEAAQRYRNEIDDSKISLRVLNRVDETLFTASAASALSANNIDAARTLAHSGLKIAPASLKLMGILANIELSQENFREAEKIIAQISGINEPLAAQLMGDMHFQKDQLPEALAAYQTAWQQKPADNLGAKIYHLIPVDNLEQKQQFFAQWKQAFPNSLYAAEIESRKFLAMGEHAKAIPLMEKIRSQQPDNAENLNNLAWSYLQLNDSRAVKIAARAYQIDDKNASIADTYGWVLLNTGNIDEAIKILEIAHQLNPEVNEIFDHLKEARARKLKQ
jgi:tetratricopeptide (TPR) repeat protein